jgi:hypothetical protein
MCPSAKPKDPDVLVCLGDVYPCFIELHYRGNPLPQSRSGRGGQLVYDRRSRSDPWSPGNPIGTLLLLAAVRSATHPYTSGQTAPADVVQRVILNLARRSAQAEWRPLLEAGLNDTPSQYVLQ